MFLCKKELPPLNIMRENSAKYKIKTQITELIMEDKKKRITRKAKPRMKIKNAELKKRNIELKPQDIELKPRN